jgi:hypothetical protein
MLNGMLGAVTPENITWKRLIELMEETFGL